MPSAEVNSVMINPHPPRLRMKRRNTVSVTPAIGANTVAGAIWTDPICTDDGTAAGTDRVGRTFLSEQTGEPPIRLPRFAWSLRAGSVPQGPGLSQNFFTFQFYRLVKMRGAPLLAAFARSGSLLTVTQPRVQIRQRFLQHLPM